MVKTILFADDNRNIREFCKRELEDEGYRVLLARDGREATQLAEAEQLDLAILDLHMPLLSGFEAAERIRAAAPRLPIMFFTSCDDECVGERRSQLAVACVEKSEDLAELKRVVGRLLAAHREVEFPADGKLTSEQGSVPFCSADAARREQPQVNLDSLRTGLPPD